ncbi:uncharacterized protein LOC134202979 [Armigeres subalbatus]|uniref:uncharacterized protein LOC134202979 n=1 Tax=Armigeres subalbatus TaxID=124917 RepID=UPI002ED24D7D
MVAPFHSITLVESPQRQVDITRRRHARKQDQASVEQQHRFRQHTNSCLSECNIDKIRTICPTTVDTSGLRNISTRNQATTRTIRSNQRKTLRQAMFTTRMRTTPTIKATQAKLQAIPPYYQPSQQPFRARRTTKKVIFPVNQMTAMSP